MKTVYYVASKNGREIEAGPFSSEHKADADMFCNNYFLATIVTKQVSEEEHAELVREEDQYELDAFENYEWTDLARYDAYLLSLETTI